MPLQIRKLRTIAYFSRVWASGMALQLGLRPTRDRMLRPRITGSMPRVTDRQVEDFILQTGGPPDLYRDPDGHLLIPHTHFVTWGLAELARAVLAARLPLNFTRVEHATARVRIHRMQQVGEPARFTSTVETVVRTGKRVRIEQQLTTTTNDAQPLAEYSVAMVLPDKRPAQGPGRPDQIVPSDARLLAAMRLPANEGWSYAQLSGDFNPVHWFGPFAKLTGMTGPVAHGFDVMTRTCHAAIAQLAGGDARRLVKIDVAFRRPIPLPAEVHIFAGEQERTAQGTDRHRLWIAPEPEALAQVTGHVEVMP